MSSTAWLILTIVGAVGSAACLYGFYGDRKRGYPALKTLDGQFELPDMRRSYSPEELFDCFEKVGPEGQKLLCRLGRTAKLLFIKLYIYFNHIQSLLSHRGRSLYSPNSIMTSDAAAKTMLSATITVMIILRTSHSTVRSVFHLCHRNTKPAATAAAMDIIINLYTQLIFQPFSPRRGG